MSTPPPNVAAGQWITVGKSTAKSHPTVRDSHRRVTKAFLDGVVGPFRRQDLTAALYPHTSPRSRPVADRLAQMLMIEMSRAGEIVRHGHLHWKKVDSQRRLRNGKTVPELSGLSTLKVQTRCPEKWAAVDMETGEIWVGTPKGWSRATQAQTDGVLACMTE